MVSKRITIVTVILVLVLVGAAMAATVDPLLRDLQSSQAKAGNPGWSPGSYWYDLVALETDVKSGDVRVGVILHLDGDLPDLGGIDGLEIGSVSGSIATARLPLRDLAELADVAGIRHIAASHMLQPTLDIGVPATNVDDVWNGSPAYTGDGVLIGIIDTGIDWRHDDFRNADGTTRIKAIWDVFGTGGTPPTGFTDGVEYDEAAINAALQGGAPVNQVDTRGHGTHVSGICAGDGSASGDVYRGVAYESDILVAKPYTNDGFPEGETIDAMNYMVQKAAALGQPIAINMSLGGHYGAHDGTSAQEQVVNNLSGPGVVFCIAAGNEGADDLAEEGPATNHPFVLNVPAYDPNDGINDDKLIVQLWYDGGTSPSVNVQVGGSNVGTVASGSSQFFDTIHGYVTIDNASSGNDPVNGDRVCYIQVDDSASSDVAADDFTITINGGSGNAHAYLAYSTMSCGFPASDGTYSVGMPACAESAVSVAAYKTRNNWPAINGTVGYGGSWGDVAIGDHAPFSSLGPTRDGRQKPDVSSPGMAIISCYSQDQDPPASNDVLLLGSQYYATQGTSMATPLTCGVVGLMLEKDPTLTAAQVRSYLRDTAAHDGFTGAGWTTRFGAGKVDAQAVIAAITGGGFADGDVDADGTATILDVILVVNYSIDPGGHPLTTDQRAAADVFPAGGGDGVVNISDAVRIVAFIMGTDTPSAPLPVSGPVAVSIGAPYRDRGTWWVPLELAGEAMAGGQFAVTVDGADWQADAVRLTGADGCAVVAKAVGHQIRVLLYSANNRIPSGTTVLLPFDMATTTASAPRLSGLLVADAHGYARETVVSGDVSALPPVRFVQVSPNPARTDTEVQFQLTRGLRVDLDVFDIKGRRVRQLTTGSLDAGVHTIGWDGRDDSQRPVAAGLYLVRLTTPEQVVTSKVVLSR